jgi:hypothetical protein
MDMETAVLPQTQQPTKLVLVDLSDLRRPHAGAGSIECICGRPISANCFFCRACAAATSARLLAEAQKHEEERIAEAMLHASDHQGSTGLSQGQISEQHGPEPTAGS